MDFFEEHGRNRCQRILIFLSGIGIKISQDGSGY